MNFHIFRCKSRWTARRRLVKAARAFNRTEHSAEDFALAFHRHEVAWLCFPMWPTVRRYAYVTRALEQL